MPPAVSSEFEGRRAPYAPISALERFLERIRDRGVPDHVDFYFLQRLNVASNNEYSLLSALKFLGVVDDRGRPTHSYRLLQTTDRFRDTLRHLVVTAYRPVFEAGADTWTDDDLVNFFRVSSSPSQAKNAARFFRAVCTLAGITGAVSAEPLPVAPQIPTDAARAPRPPAQLQELVLVAKAKLLEKLPPPDSSWTAEQYEAICDKFLEMLRHLDA
ncbi:MAG TPA: DUF5343 domain-containing protein [Chloroflexota bacterium]|nr:DUF5343 domain-containing protein [Chloroflexota bacterium]